MASTVPNQTVLIIGASVRYCAQSARRAGLSCLALDMFGDWDLKQSADSSIQLPNLSMESVLAVLKQAPSLPGIFLLSGGMEKRVELVRAMSSQVGLVGSGVEAIDKTNDPFFIQEACRQNEIAFPRSVSFADCVSLPVIGGKQQDAIGGWLVKEKASAGGSRVKRFDPSQDLPRQFSDSEYLQQYICGQSYSSVCFAHDGNTELVGSTRQLVGQLPFVADAKRFNYCGSIGPIAIPDQRNERLQCIGQRLCDSFGLNGVFGFDWILDDEGCIWLIEINPRITASCELFEAAGLGSLVGMQAGVVKYAGQAELMNSPLKFGKAIVYSTEREPFTVDRELFEHFCNQQFSIGSIGAVGKPASECECGYADIPASGTVVEPGHPVVTVIESGISCEQVHSKLVSRTKMLRQRIRKLERNKAVRA